MGASSRPSLRRMERAEVMQHSQPNDLWMVVDNVVYDCTEWLPFHPGGEAVLMDAAGRDVTELYKYYHAWVGCDALLMLYAVGYLAEGGGAVVDPPPS